MSAVSIKHKECAVKLKLAQYDQQAEISRQKEESEALRAQEEIDKKLELEFKQLEYKKRLASQRKENIQRNLVINQKEREVKRAEKEVKAWEEVSNAFTIINYSKQMMGHMRIRNCIIIRGKHKNHSKKGGKQDQRSIEG